MRYFKFFLTTLLVIFMPIAGHAEVKTGQSAPDFTLTDTNGKAQALSSYKGKYVVLEWFNFDCPFVVKHYGSGNMQKLQKEFMDKGVVWLSINSSASGKEGFYSPQETNKKAGENGMKPTAIMLDSDGKVARLYGAKTTPHMFVINPQGTLIYQGAIDDKPSTDQADIAGAKNYVRAALDAAMAGKPVEKGSTKSYGCSVKY
jgi:peroxiredoxin